jgi:peroxiredoxin
MSKKLDLTIPIFSDHDNALATKFGLVFSLPQDLREVYLSFGIDLERHNGNDAWTLPMPACYIIGQDGMILDAAVSADYTTRPEPNEILSKLKSLTRA